jgi:hypothetical protein
MPVSLPGSNRRRGYLLAKLVNCGIFAAMKRRAHQIALPMVAALTIGLGAAGLSAQTAKAPAPPPVAVTQSTAPAPVKGKPATITVSADGQTVYVVGMILEGTFHQFDDVLLKAPKARRVHLSSSGGYTLEARLMASLVRKRKLDTYVEVYCASACTQVFAAGKSRVIGPAAQLGFHQASLVDDTSGETITRERTDRKLTATTVFGINGNDTLRLAYELIGTDPAFINKALSHSHESMWLPTQQELIDAKFITRVAAEPEWPLPLGSSGARAAVRARLIAAPLWQVALEKLPAAAEAAVDDVWRAYNSGSSFEAAAVAGRSKLVVFVTKSLAEAPDPLLDRSLTLYANSARSERSRGYPGCKTALGIVPLPTEATDLEFIQFEDALIVEFLSSPQRAKRLDGDEATRYFTKEVVPLIAPLFSFGSASGQTGKCKMGLQMFEAIDAMPMKKRVKAYRALLSLPGMAEI